MTAQNTNDSQSDSRPLDPSTPEYDEAMVMKFATENPNALPPEFRGNPEAFLKAWKDTKAAYTRSRQELAELKKQLASQSSNDDDVSSDDDANSSDGGGNVDPVNRLQIDDPDDGANSEQGDAIPDKYWSKLEQEFLASGDLSKETRKNLREQYKIPDVVIDQYLNGLRSLQKQAAEEAAQLLGGEEELSALLKWASKNLTAEERIEINKALNGPLWQTALLGLQARRQKASPKNNEPSLVATESARTSGASGYPNQEAMKRDLRDPRYGTDPDFTKLVQDRIRMTASTKRYPNF